MRQCHGRLRFSMARSVHIDTLCQFAVLRDESQAVLQLWLLGLGFQATSQGQAGQSPQLGDLSHSLWCLQQVVVAARGMHRGAIGCNGSSTRDDGRNGTSTKGVHVKEVLTMHHNQIDECDNLTDVGNSSTDVDGTKSLWNALQHIQWCPESACLALVKANGLVDGNTHVGLSLSISDDLTCGASGCFLDKVWLLTHQTSEYRDLFHLWNSPTYQFSLLLVAPTNFGSSKFSHGVRVALSIPNIFKPLDKSQCWPPPCPHPLRTARRCPRSPRRSTDDGPEWFDRPVRWSWWWSIVVALECLKKCGTVSFVTRHMFKKQPKEHIQVVSFPISILSYYLHECLPT